MRSRKFSIFCLLFPVVFFSSIHFAYADHLKGGWIKYTYTGNVGGKVQYHVSFYQYSDCSQPEKVDQAISLAVHDAGTLDNLFTDNIALTKLTNETKQDFGPCVSNPPIVCYLVAEYTTDISVPENTSGYILTVQRCCRIAGIQNVYMSNRVGITYTVTIPGGSNKNDNSPDFGFDDLIAICYSSPFSFDFSAKDADNDSLVYSLCSGLNGGSQDNPVVADPPAPPYFPAPYIAPYGGTRPLGSFASIDPHTGIYSGHAPADIGTYVIAVCVDEYRKGFYIGHTRKELHVNVTNCLLAVAGLNESYLSCKGYDFTFSNNYPDNPGLNYHWDFGIKNKINDTSSFMHPTYTYPDTGVYNVSLHVINAAGCQDSAKTQVKIYPGFSVDFSTVGNCENLPYNFTDLTKAKYGYVNSWFWDLVGDNNHFDTTQNPEFFYTLPGLYNVKLTAKSSLGCVDTAKKVIAVEAGPDLRVRFNDTLICSIDTLQLQSSSIEATAFSWLPDYNVINAASSNPSVYPKQTTNYMVTATNKDGCITKDSVLVNVTNRVTLSLPNDTTICKTDSIKLTPLTNALYFSWTPANGLNKNNIESPKAAPFSNTKYNLIASIGKCFAQDNINIKVVPYPEAEAGNDVSICFGKTTQLSANIKAAYFTWTPTSTLVNSNTLTPVAGPQSTTSYVLKVTDTLGCPKPVYDSVLVTVIPKVIAFAGNDTSVVRTQPLQLTATGGANYSWVPAINLSNPYIANPVASFSVAPDTISYTVKVSTPEGCFSNDSIKIFIFETQPEVFIPTAFTPNGDGKNDVFRPTVAGMKQFLYFRVYNRFGKLIFSTEQQNKGWDGTYNENRQASGTYIYSVQAIDYTGKPYFKKGTFVLIR